MVALAVPSVGARWSEACSRMRCLGWKRSASVGGASLPSPRKSCSWRAPRDILLARVARRHSDEPGRERRLSVVESFARGARSERVRRAVVRQVELEARMHCHRLQLRVEEPHLCKGWQELVRACKGACARVREAHLGQSDLLGDVMPAVASEVWLGAWRADAQIPPPPDLEAARIAAARPSRGGDHACSARRDAAAGGGVEALSSRTVARAAARVQLSIAGTPGNASAVTHFVRLGTARRQGEIIQSEAKPCRLQRVSVEPNLSQLAIDEARGEARRLQAVCAAHKDGRGGRVQCRLFRRDAGAIGPWRASKVSPVQKVAAAGVSADRRHMVPAIPPHPRQCRIHGRALCRVDQVHLDPHLRPEGCRQGG
eukprot:scaffold15072_cov68-Phaeocystis_antarctica.AAC.17